MKDKYARAALRVTAGEGLVLRHRVLAGRVRSRSPRGSTPRGDRGAARRGRGPRRSAAAIPPRSPSSSPGETVLDLGSGGGIDVLLSAKRVGPTGKAYGLDMTDEMLALARENQRKAGGHERGVPQGRDRADPAPVELGGRHHLQLRDQSLGRQGPGARGGVPRAQAGRTLRGVGRRGARRGPGRRSAAASSSGSAAWPARSRSRSTATSSPGPGFEAVDVEPTRIYRVEDAREFLEAPGSTWTRSRPRSTASS